MITVAGAASALLVMAPRTDFPLPDTSREKIYRIFVLPVNVKVKSASLKALDAS